MPVFRNRILGRVIRMPPRPIKQTRRQRADQITRRDAERLNLAELLDIMRAVLDPHVGHPEALVPIPNAGRGRVAVSRFLADLTLAQTDASK